MNKQKGEKEKLNMKAKVHDTRDRNNENKNNSKKGQKRKTIKCKAIMYRKYDLRRIMLTCPEI